MAAIDFIFVLAVIIKYHCCPAKIKTCVMPERSENRITDIQLNGVMG
jgi:hypothetical protein